jgi:hypothetical protein
MAEALGSVVAITACRFLAIDIPTCEVRPLHIVDLSTRLRIINAPVVSTATMDTVVEMLRVTWGATSLVVFMTANLRPPGELRSTSTWVCPQAPLAADWEECSLPLRQVLSVQIVPR